MAQVEDETQDKPIDTTGKKVVHFNNPYAAPSRIRWSPHTIKLMVATGLETVLNI
jgi:hypothetical protein